MCDHVIKIDNLGKMYKLYTKKKDKILDAFGLNFWKKNYYEEFWALRDMNLTVRKGERVGLIGNNGAGKSTLLKTIIGNITPTEGKINVNGKIQALMELGTGFHPEFTGRENIRASLAYQGLTQEQISEREQEIIDFSELEEFIDQPIRTYSAGMNARLAFSTATAIEPDILIIDEVLGAGDAYFAGKCVERMRKITEDSGATVLFVSHDLNSVLQLCDRVIWIDRGQIKLEGEPLETVKAYTSAVRKREEYRLRARDLKLNKKHAVLLDKKEDIYDSMLFHFVTENGEFPQQKNKIYDIELLNEDEEIGSINIGGPMDNSPEQEHFIMDNKQYMNWSIPSKDDIGMYRCFENMGGEYKHAPFQFTIPKVLSGEKFTINLYADVKEKLFLEVYDGEKYKRISEIIPCGYYKYKIKFNLESNNEVASDIKYDLTSKNLNRINNLNKETDCSISDYGSKEATIIDVKMLNGRGMDSKVFETGESIQVVVDYEAKQDISGAVFVFCIYTTDGRCASQWIADSQVYKRESLPLKGSCVFAIDELLIGRGSYIASVAIFKQKSNNSVEAESYHVIDRSIHFEIRQPLEDSIERGICLQPFKGDVVNGE